jgi:formamidopyrimidine-DNA glycosylase
MPELPEVETTCRGIAPHITGRTFTDVIVRDRRLRWPVTRQLRDKLLNKRILAVERRAKYLIFTTSGGYMLVHLGMSGSLRIDSAERTHKPHDHIEWQFDNGVVLRLHDPRRFGSVHWIKDAPEQHALLRDLGPEPLTDAFDGGHLYRTSRKRAVAVKNFIMNAGVVVGVGNIYANEALFLAGIKPARAAGRLSAAQCDALATTIKEVLADAIRQGGTTLRDFVNAEGNPGYFRQQLRVYERTGQPCVRCGGRIRHAVLGQRSSYHCPQCQR